MGSYSKRSVAAASLFLVACAQVQHRARLTEISGQVKTAAVGAPIATIRKEKDLPNIIGRADIYGRKVDTGFTKLLFMGRGPKGEVLLQRVDVDVHSTASALSAPGQLHGIGEKTAVLPSRSINFSVPAGKTLPLHTGQMVEFMSVEPHQVSYRITAGQ